MGLVIVCSSLPPVLDPFQDQCNIRGIVVVRDTPLYSHSFHAVVDSLLWVDDGGGKE